jgi:hypothetical protein
VGIAVMARILWHKRGLLGGCHAHSGSETSVGMLQTIEQTCSDFLAHTSEVCKGAHLYNEYLAI